MKKKFIDRLISPASHAFIKEALQTKNFSVLDLIHGYVYGRWTYLYISIGIGEHPLASKYASAIRWLANLLGPNEKQPEVNVKDKSRSNKMSLADTYHGKVVPLQAARELVTINQVIDLPDLEQVIPYKRATDIILRNPEHIVALECPCRSARPDPCLPLDVCLVVGEPFAGFVMQHSSERARWISQSEAVEILKAEDLRGHVHHAFFKDAMLGRFYAICNCCACCCGAMQSQRNGNPMLASSGYVCRVNEDLCLGCGSCEEYCQFGALSVPDGYASVDSATCMGCGVCIDKCDQEALWLASDPSRGKPLEIFRLMEEAAQVHQRIEI